MIAVERLAPDRIGDALTLFRATLHRKPFDADAVRALEASDPERSWGAFLAGELIGTTWSFAAHTAVPGGALVPTAAISRVGVRADRTRRGVLTALLGTQLAELRERGEVLATLRASEGGIYGRFGFGVASYSRDVVVNTHRARLLPAAPQPGPLRLLDAEATFDELPAVFQRIGPTRPGAMTRPAHWWPVLRALATGSHTVTVLHGEAGAEDGYASYEVSRGEHSCANVLDRFTSGPRAFAGIWRFLLGLDLVDEVRWSGAPLDDPLEHLLDDPRACRVTGVADEMWLRLLDVPAALAARAYGVAEPVVLGVHDPLLTANSGRYLIGPHGMHRSTAAPQLELDVRTLAAVYQGGTTPSTMATAGLLTVHDTAALHRADTLFGSAIRPWCGTFF